MSNQNAGGVVSRSRAVVLHYLIKRRGGRSISNIRSFLALSGVNLAVRSVSTMVSAMRKEGLVDIRYGKEDLWIATQEGKDANIRFLAPFSAKLHDAKAITRY